MNSGNQSARLPSLDGVRGVAILMVLGAHLTITEGFTDRWRTAWNLVFDGATGVRIFFTLSGLLITHLLLTEEEKNGGISVAGFYARRAFRILPPYFAFLAVLFILSKETRVTISSAGWISSLTFTKNFWGGQWIDGHLWSLSVEEQFYLLWPIVLLTCKRVGRITFAFVLIATAPLLRAWFYWLGEFNLQQHSFFGAMDTLMIGCLAAIGLHTWPLTIQRVVEYKVAWIRTLSLGLICFGWLLEKNLAAGVATVPFESTVQCVATAYLLLSTILVRRGLLFQILNWRPLAGLGLISYGLYIWQQLFMVAPGVYHAGHSSLATRFPWAVFAALICAIISYLVLEKPALELRSRYRKIRRPIAAPVTVA